MSAGGATRGGLRPGELHVVGTSVTREVELLFDRVAQSVGKRAPRVLQVGIAHPSVSDRNVRNWRETRSPGTVRRQGTRSSALISAKVPTSTASPTFAAIRGR